jgi:hypothetical protein
LGTLWATNIITADTVTITKAGINITTAAASGGTARLGIYAHSGGPGALVYDLGSIATNGALGVREVVVPNLVLAPGKYWLA